MVDSYKKALAFHDWFYQYSDDQRVWRKGEDSWANLRRLQPNYDPDYTIWNQYAPAEYKMYPKVKSIK